LVREGAFKAADFQRLIMRLEGDVASGLLKVAAVSSRRLQGAAQLLGMHGLTTPIRTLDAIHLATAQALHSRASLAALVAADKRLLASAAACGLTPLDVG
jgi:hypothetical protein